MKSWKLFHRKVYYYKRVTKTFLSLTNFKWGENFLINNIQFMLMPVLNGLIFNSSMLVVFLVSQNCWHFSLSFFSLIYNQCTSYCQLIVLCRLYSVTCSSLYTEKYIFQVCVFFHYKNYILMAFIVVHAVKISYCSWVQQNFFCK